jgi:hypothetical protein
MRSRVPEAKPPSEELAVRNPNPVADNAPSERSTVPLGQMRRVGTPAGAFEIPFGSNLSVVTPELVSVGHISCTFQIPD